MRERGSRGGKRRVIGGEEKISARVVSSPNSSACSRISARVIRRRADEFDRKTSFVLLLTLEQASAASGPLPLALFSPSLGLFTPTPSSARAVPRSAPSPPVRTPRPPPRGSRARTGAIPGMPGAPPRRSSPPPPPPRAPPRRPASPAPRRKHPRAVNAAGPHPTHRRTRRGFHPRRLASANARSSARSRASRAPSRSATRSRISSHRSSRRRTRLATPPRPPRRARLLRRLRELASVRASSPARGTRPRVPYAGSSPRRACGRRRRAASSLAARRGRLALELEHAPLDARRSAPPGLAAVLRDLAGELADAFVARVSATRECSRSPPEGAGASDALSAASRVASAALRPPRAPPRACLRVRLPRLERRDEASRRVTLSLERLHLPVRFPNRRSARAAESVAGRAPAAARNAASARSSNRRRARRGLGGTLALRLRARTPEPSTSADEVRASRSADRART